jgi:drug/metabolite transporter (DMT)-like permease
MKYLVFILFTVMTNAAAQVMLKQGMTSLGPLGFDGVNPFLRILQIVFNPWVFLGLCTFVISTASYLYVLSKVELSFAVPFLSLAYVVVAVFSYLVFHEDLNAWRVAGIAFICVGTVLIAQGGSGHQADASEQPVRTSNLNR